MSDLQFREVAYASPLYRRLLRLRERQLREPLGLHLSENDLTGEEAQWHFALLDEAEEPVACVVAAPDGDCSVRLRQMAVDDEQQSRGLGRRLLRDTEQALRQRGIECVTLHARCTAQGFYERMGYAVSGPEFVEVTIPHVPMQRRLNPRD